MGEWKRDELRRARAELRRARTQALGAEKERQRREIKKALRERVVAPITQGVASEGVEKPLPKVEVCRWCKGDPRGLLMLNKYVPCTECSPIVTQVHDEIVCEVPEKGSSYEQMDGRRRLVEEILSQQMDMSWVKDELYVPVPDTVLRQKMVEQGGPSKKAIEDLKEYAREKGMEGYELRAPVSADEAREEQKRREARIVVDVQDPAPRRSARMDGINWVIPLSETEKKQMEDRVLRVAKSRDGLTHRPGAEKAAEKFKAEKGKTYKIKIRPDSHVGQQDPKSFYELVREFLSRPVADLEKSKTYEQLCQMLRPGVEPKKVEKPSYGISPEVEKELARDWELRQQQMAMTTAMISPYGTWDAAATRRMGELLGMSEELVETCVKVEETHQKMREQGVTIDTKKLGMLEDMLDD